MRRRLKPCLLAALLCLTLTLPARAATTAQGTTLRLEDVEGTVKVCNAAGKTLTTKTGSKLYNGYVVSTDAASYAWISLDDDVLVKLDENSKATIKQSKKKLQVILKSGQLFFNVSKKLVEEESLDIRTSSMSTGIRGTSGLISTHSSVERTAQTNGVAVRTINRSVTTVYDGSVAVTLEESAAAAAGGAGATTVAAGFRAEVVVTAQHTEQQSGAVTSGTQTTVETALSPVSVAESIKNTGFVAVEVAGNADYQEKLLTSDIGVGASELQQIIGNAQTQLRADQSASAAQVAESQQAAEEETKSLTAGAGADAATVVPVYDQSTSSGSGSTVTVPPAPEPKEWTVRFYTTGQSGKVLFAQQKVTDGEQITIPTLRPTESGAWYAEEGETAFNFKPPVAADLDLIWRQTES